MLEMDARNRVTSNEEQPGADLVNYVHRQISSTLIKKVTKSSTNNFKTEITDREVSFPSIMSTNNIGESRLKQRLNL